MAGLRYTRYPASPTAPPFGSSSAVTAAHDTIRDVSLGVTATVSGAFGAVVSAPAVVSTMPRRKGCQMIESPPPGWNIIRLSWTVSVEFHQLRVRVNFCVVLFIVTYTPLSGLVGDVRTLFFCSVSEVTSPAR